MWTLFQPNWDIYIQLSVWLPLSEGWGASCPGWFILPPAKDLGQTVSSVNSYCTIIVEYLLVRDVNIISAKLRCLHPMFSLVTLFRGLPLPPTPCQYITQLNVWSKHLRLTEIKFISISTKFSCNRWCNKICISAILSEILGGGQDKPPWTACPPPLVNT